MDVSIMPTLQTLNTSFLRTKPGVNNQTNYASLYLQDDVTYMLWLVVPPVLLVLGCYGNVMTMVVMRGLRASECTACLSVYFTALAVSDLCLLITFTLWYWPEMAFDTPLDYFHDISCTTPFFVSYVSSMTSAWFLVAMTCQRLLSVVLPHRVGVLCTVRRGKVVVAAIVTAACMINLPIFFNYRVQKVDRGYDMCVSIDEDTTNTFGILDLCFASLIPFMILIVANCVLIYRTLQSMQMARTMTARDTQQTTSRSAKVSSMTTTLILTSTAFLVLSLPTCIFDIYLEENNFYEGEIEDESLNAVLAMADTVCLLMWMSNSAVNFYIYILSGRKFREETTRCLCACLRRDRKPQRA